MIIELPSNRSDTVKDTLALLEILAKAQEEKQYEVIDEEQKRRVYWNDKY